MSLFRRSIARETRQFAPEPIIPPIPGMSVFGNGVSSSAEGALQLDAVWACVRLLADTVSMMPLQAYTLTSDGVRVPVGQQPAWLRSPAGQDTTTFDWVYQLMTSLLLRGNAYGLIVSRDSVGYPTQIEWLNPDALRVNESSGVLEVRDRTGKLIPSSNLFRPSAYRFPGKLLGLSPIAYARATLSTSSAVQSYALGYFQDALQPASVLTTDQVIDQTDAESIKERVMKQRGSREPLVLGANLKYQPLSVSPDESQFLATQKWSVASICRVFGVPPEMVAAEAGNSMTYSNVEQRAIDFLTYSVQPWLSRLEAAMYGLLPGKQHLRFDPSVLLRTDLQTQMTATAIGIASKQTTPDEARAMRDEPPLTAVQKALLNLIPLTVQPTGKPAVSGPSKPPIVDFGDPDAEDPSDNQPSGGN